MQDVTNRFLNRGKIKPTKFVFTPKSTGKKRRVKKPGWDDSVSDLSRYKLSKEEMQRRKMSFLSPHNVLTSKSKKKKKKKSLTTKDVQDKLKALKSRETTRPEERRRNLRSLDLLIKNLPTVVRMYRHLHLRTENHWK